MSHLLGSMMRAGAERSARLHAWRDRCLARLAELDPVQTHGVVTEVGGLLIGVRMPPARIGELCLIEIAQRPPRLAEVVGFDEQGVRLAALGSLDGLGCGAPVRSLGRVHQIRCDDTALGQVYDGFGRPLRSSDAPSGTGLFAVDGPPGTDVMRDAGVALDRPCIETVAETGLRAIDSLMTLGQGQRVGIFAPAGCGKTTLLAALARGIEADAVVFALIGERGRELNEFLERELDDTLRRRAVMICATSDRSPMERVRAAFTATSVAESLARGGRHVLLLVDSLTRLARAQREIGLSLGEPPARAGFPPSVYALLPRLIERAGRFTDATVTAIYTVLAEQEDSADPIAEEARSLLDGHLILSRKLAEQAHFPAIDVLASLSRVMPALVDDRALDTAARTRELLARYRDIELLLRLGEYREGSDARSDRAIRAYPDIQAFLRQGRHDMSPMANACRQLENIVA